jgi:hypothetical protein
MASMPVMTGVLVVISDPSDTGHVILGVFMLHKIDRSSLRLFGRFTRSRHHQSRGTSFLDLIPLMCLVVMVRHMTASTTMDMGATAITHH